MAQYLANDKYSATLRSTWIADPADATLAVTSIPTNFPTIITVGWKTQYETVFGVTSYSGDNSSNYALTGVTRLKGANANIPEGTALNCLNHEEYFNQWGTAIAEVQASIDETVVDVENGVNRVKLTQSITGEAPRIDPIGSDSNIGIDTRMKGTGKWRKPTVVHIPAVSAGSDTEVGDGKAFFEVPEELAGMNITAVGAYVYTAGTTNTTDVQIRNVTQSADILSTKITIDSTEVSSRSGATQAVINTSEDDLQLGDRLAIDIDAVSTTPAKGLVVWFRAELPA